MVLKNIMTITVREGGASLGLNGVWQSRVSWLVRIVVEISKIDGNGGALKIKRVKLGTLMRTE